MMRVSSGYENLPVGSRLTEYASVSTHIDPKNQQFTIHQRYPDYKRYLQAVRRIPASTIHHHSEAAMFGTQNNSLRVAQLRYYTASRDSLA